MCLQRLCTPWLLGMTRVGTVMLYSRALVYLDGLPETGAYPFVWQTYGPVYDLFWQLPKEELQRSICLAGVCIRDMGTLPPFQAPGATSRMRMPIQNKDESEPGAGSLIEGQVWRSFLLHHA